MDPRKQQPPNPLRTPPSSAQRPAGARNRFAQRGGAAGGCDPSTQPPTGRAPVGGGLRGRKDNHSADFIINQLIDLEADGQLNKAEAVLAAAAPNDPGLLKQLAQTQRVLAMLRQPGEMGKMAPGVPRDLTNGIIDRVEQERLYQPRPVRRRVSGLRAVIASCGFAALAVAGLLQLRTPERAHQWNDPRSGNDLAIAAQGEHRDPKFAAGVGERVGEGLDLAADVLARSSYSLLAAQTAKADSSRRVPGPHAAPSLELTFNDTIDCSGAGQSSRSVKGVGGGMGEDAPRSLEGWGGGTRWVAAQRHCASEIVVSNRDISVNQHVRPRTGLVNTRLAPSAVPTFVGSTFSESTLQGFSPVLPEWRWLFETQAPGR